MTAAVKTNVSTAANDVVDFFRQWGPLMLAVVTGPVGLIAYGIVKHWDEIKAQTIAIWNAIKDSGVNAWQWFYDHNYYFQDLVDSIKEAWADIKAATTAV